MLCPFGFIVIAILGFFVNKTHKNKKYTNLNPSFFGLLVFFKREKEKKEKNSTQARWMSEKLILCLKDLYITNDHDQRNLDQNTVKCINPLSSVNTTQNVSFNMKAFVHTTQID